MILKLTGQNLLRTFVAFSPGQLWAAQPPIAPEGPNRLYTDYKQIMYLKGVNVATVCSWISNCIILDIKYRAGIKQGQNPRCYR